MGSRFSCMNPEMKRLSLDLGKLLKHREFTLEVGCGGVFRSLVEFIRKKFFLILNLCQEKLIFIAFHVKNVNKSVP